MSPRRITPWLRAPYLVTSWAGAELAEVDPVYVPIILADLEPRKARNLWVTEASWVLGYEGICKQQEALLMGAVETLMRGLFYQMGYPRDVELAADGFPLVELPEATLFAIRTRLGDPGDFTIYSRLEAIRVLLEAQGLSGDEVEGLLSQIVLLLAA